MNDKFGYSDMILNNSQHIDNNKDNKKYSKQIN